MLPDESAGLQAGLARALGDDQIKVTPLAPAKPSPPSPLTPEVIGTIEKLTQAMWPAACRSCR